MAYCVNCGKNIEDGSRFCPSCGAKQSTENDPKINLASGELNVGQLVWSIINLVMCCLPLGIASLILTILAKDAFSAEEEARKLKAAKICNLVGTISVSVLVVLYIILYVIFIAIGIGTVMWY